MVYVKKNGNKIESDTKINIRIFRKRKAYWKRLGRWRRCTFDVNIPEELRMRGGLPNFY
jgi:hypothetical protein